MQVSCPNNNACYDQNIYLNGNTERRFTCNCPDSTTNIFVNLTAFSDALPPDEESISANGLPLVNTLISVDGEFDALKHATDAGGFLKVNSIPYGYHDFDFYYCLDANLSQNGRCDKVWHSYSRANIQPGTRYVNFALNVDAIHAQIQGNASGFESYSYKDGKWIMTAKRYEKKVLPIILVFAGVALVSIAATYISADQLEQRNCFYADGYGTYLNTSRMDCNGFSLLGVVGLTGIVATGEVAIPLGMAVIVSRPALESIGKNLMTMAVKPISRFVELKIFDPISYRLRVLVGRTSGEILKKEAPESLIESIPKIQRPQLFGNNIGETTVNRNILGRQKSDAIGHSREILRREEFKRVSKPLISNNVRVEFDYYVGEGRIAQSEYTFEREYFGGTYRAGIRIYDSQRQPLMEIDVPVVTIQDSLQGKSAEAVFSEVKGAPTNAVVFDSPNALFKTGKEEIRNQVHEAFRTDIAEREGIPIERVKIVREVNFDKDYLSDSRYQNIRQQLISNKEEIISRGWFVSERSVTLNELENYLRQFDYE